MKKLLTATLAVATGAACIWSLAACNTDNGKDAETAQSAVNYIQTLYDKLDYAETTSGYTLPGKVSVDSKLYNVKWTVSTQDASVNNITDYIQIGTELDEDYKLTVNVERPETDVAYTLTCTVKVGKASKSLDIERTLIGLPAGSILSVADALALKNDMSKFINITSGQYTNPYYKGDGEDVAEVTVRGYVITVPSYSADHKNYSNAYIADSATETEAANKLQVYRIKPDGVYLKEDGSTNLQKGDFVTFTGCLEYYNNKTMELTYYGSGASAIDVKVVNLQRDTSDRGKVDAALADVSLLPSYMAGTVTLPNTSCGANLTWKVKSGSDVSISGYTMTVATPNANTTATVTVTIKSGSVTETKDITFNVIKAFEAGTYHVSIDQVQVNKTLYYTGAFDGDFGAASVNASDAVDVVAEVSGNGFTLKVNEKYLELDSSHKIKLLDAPSTTVWIFNEELGVLTFKVGTTEYYLGTHGTYETLSASAISYISGANASTVGVSQFVAKFEKVADPGPDTRDDAEKVAAAIEALSLNSTYEAGEVNLVTSSNGATITWQVISGAAIASVNYTTNKLVLLNPASAEADGSVSVKATITCGAVTDYKTFPLTVTYVAPINYGDADHPLSVTEAKAIADDLGSNAWTKQVVWMKGIVETTAVISSNGQYYQTFSIKDENSSSTISVYSINLRAGVAAPVQNDVVTISGYITNYNGTKIQFSRNTNVSPTVEVYLEENVRGTSTITTNVADGMAISGLGATAENGTTATFTVTGEVPSDKTLVVEVNGTEVSATAGSYSFTVAGDATVSVILKGSNVVTKPIDVTKQGWADKATISTSATAGEATVTFAKAEGSTATAYYNPEVRAYYGNTITVKVNAGYKITSIQFTYGTAGNGNKLTANVGEFDDTNWTGSANQVVFTVGTNSNGESKGNLRITGIKITYEVEESTASTLEATEAKLNED